MRFLVIALGVLLPGLLRAQQAQQDGYAITYYDAEETVPGMLLIEGGSFPFSNGDSTRYDKYLPSFYLAAKEESNAQYLFYLNWIRRIYSKASYLKALPDTTVWLSEPLPDTLKSYLARYYLRHPAFADYPVVGVSPEQINNYISWKTDRLNEMVLVREGLLEFFEGDSAEMFYTDAYLSGKWQGQLKNKLPSFDPQSAEREIRMEDGLFFPKYRLPTVEEWKAAALALGDENHSYLKTPRETDHRKYDKGHHYWYLYEHALARASEKKDTLPIPLTATGKTPANNYLLKGMYGNVSEWTQSDSAHYLAMGGSWKFPEPVYAAGYYKWSGMVQYTIPYVFITSNAQKHHVSGATGFRLAMDSRLGVARNSKRRKVK